MLIRRFGFYRSTDEGASGGGDSTPETDNSSSSNESSSEPTGDGAAAIYAELSQAGVDPAAAKAPEAEDTKDAEVKTDDLDNEDDWNLGDKPADAEGDSDSQKDRKADEGSEGDEVDAEKEVSQLAEEIREKLGDAPELIERFDKQLSGLQKLREKVQGERDALITDAKGFETYQTYESALANPEMAPVALQTLAKMASELHGVTVESLLGVQKADTSDELPVGPNGLNPDGEQDWEKQGFDSAFELEMAKKLDALDKRQAQVDQQRDQDAKARKDAETASANERAFREKTLPSIKQKLAALHMGWKVPDDAIVAAVQAFPQIDPVKAVEAAHARNLGRHYARQASTRSGAKTPEMPKGSGSQRQRVKSADEYSAADAAADVRGH